MISEYCLFSFVQLSDTHCQKINKKPEKLLSKAFPRIWGYRFHWKDSLNTIYDDNKGAFHLYSKLGFKVERITDAMKLKF